MIDMGAKVEIDRATAEWALAVLGRRATPACHCGMPATCADREGPSGGYVNAACDAHGAGRPKLRGSRAVEDLERALGVRR